MTIIVARFMPFICTFAPFVAGVAEMTRSKFTVYNVIGAIIWVIGLTAAGCFFGNLPWVQANLSTIIWALIIIPGLIAILGTWRARVGGGLSASWRAMPRSARGTASHNTPCSGPAPAGQPLASHLKPGSSESTFRGRVAEG